MSIGIPPCITLNFTIIMGEKEHDGRHKGRLRRKAYVTGPSLAKATCGSWLKKWKATVTPDPNRPLRGNGSELHSPSHMFLGLALRSLLIIRSKNRSDSPEQRALHPSNCSIPLAIASAILSRNASLKSICSSLAFVIKRHSTSALGIVDLRLT